MKLSDNELKVHLMSYEKNLEASTGGCRYRFVFDSKTPHGSYARAELGGEERNGGGGTFLLREHIFFNPRLIFQISTNSNIDYRTNTNNRESLDNRWSTDNEQASAILTIEYAIPKMTIYRSSNHPWRQRRKFPTTLLQYLLGLLGLMPI